MASIMSSSMTGHHYHVRVVINGHYAYDRGGDYCKWVAQDVYDGPMDYDPLSAPSDKCQFGLHYIDDDGKTVCINKEDVESLRLIFITRRRNHRRIDRVIHYHYYNGRLVGWNNVPLRPYGGAYYKSTDPEYRETINHQSMANFHVKGMNFDE
ncbi:MAG: hypothetical protein NC114_06250 [Ruminococcus flavefaciens]|nr:hypothetical protein [Ruminococcus flavefaciens]